MAAPGFETGILTDVFLPLSLAIIMFGMGLSLKVSDFKRLLSMPRAVGAGLFGQIVLLPLAAMAVTAAFILWFGLSLELALGLLLLSAVPGGATSNLLTFLGKGDHALSVTLTSIVSLGAVLLTPGVLFATTSLLFGDATMIEVSFAEMATLVLAIVAIPVALGMAANARWPGLHAKVDKPLRITGALILAGLIGLIIYQNRADFWTQASLTVPAALALNVVAFAVGLWVGIEARLPEDQRRCLAFEVGFQNGTLGIVLAVSQLGSAQAALMPAFYGLVMFFTGGALAWFWARTEPDDQLVDVEISIREIVGEPDPEGPRVS